MAYKIQTKDRILKECDELLAVINLHKNENDTPIDVSKLRAMRHALLWAISADIDDFAEPSRCGYIFKK